VFQGSLENPVFKAAPTSRVLTWVDIGYRRRTWHEFREGGSVCKLQSPRTTLLFFMELATRKPSRKHVIR